MSLENTTVKNLIEYLKGQDYKVLLQEKINNFAYWTTPTRADVYRWLDDIIVELVEEKLKYIPNSENNDFCMSCSCSNLKDRYIIIKRKDNIKGGTAYLLQIDYSIKTKKGESKGYSLESITFINEFNEEISNKTFRQLINEAVEQDKEQVRKNKEDRLPQHIEEVEKLFQTVIKKMKNGESFTCTEEYRVRVAITKYNELNEKELIWG